MPKYTVDITETEQAGYDFQSALTGEAVQDMIQRQVSERGVAYTFDAKRAKVQDLVAKIEKEPEDYVASIDQIYDAKVAAEEVELLARLEALAALDLEPIVTPVVK